MTGAVYINVPIEVALRCAQGLQTQADRLLLIEKLKAAAKRSDRAVQVLADLPVTHCKG